MSERQERAGAVTGELVPSGGEALPLVEAYNSDGVDLTLVRAMLRKTPAQRLDAVQDAIDLLASTHARPR